MFREVADAIGLPRPQTIKSADLIAKLIVRGVAAALSYCLHMLCITIKNVVYVEDIKRVFFVRYSGFARQNSLLNWNWRLVLAPFKPLHKALYFFKVNLNFQTGFLNMHWLCRDWYYCMSWFVNMRPYQHPSLVFMIRQALLACGQFWTVALTVSWVLFPNVSLRCLRKYILALLPDNLYYIPLDFQELELCIRQVLV